MLSLLRKFDLSEEINEILSQIRYLVGIRDDVKLLMKSAETAFIR